VWSGVSGLKTKEQRLKTGVFGVYSASITSCLKNINFFNLVLASHRLSCYLGCFSGEYSSISQEYPPTK